MTKTIPYLKQLTVQLEGQTCKQMSKNKTNSKVLLEHTGMLHNVHIVFMWRTSQSFITDLEWVMFEHI